MTGVDIELIGVPVFVIDIERDGGFRVAGINRADAEALGLSAAAVAGCRIEDCAPPAVAVHTIERLSTCVARGGLLEYDEPMEVGGTTRWWRTTLTPAFDPASGRVVRIVGVSVEITQRKQAEVALAQAVLLDPLTGVMNRRGLEQGVAAQIERCAPTCGTFALVVVDLDQFKAINDAHGHQTGDAVLRHIAQLLQMSASPGETVARLGGDEFALLLRVPSDAELQLRMGILRRLADRDLHLNGRDLRVSASLGGALWTGTGTLDDLLASADADMYRHKHLRRTAA